MTKSRPQPLYELAPVNGRDAQKQARYYGYSSLDHLAADLPTEARVIDVGAGISNLGKEVAKLRPDITWTYFDRCYTSFKLLNQARGDDTPPNVLFVSGDILWIEDSGLTVGSFDRAFSSRLIPHIDMESPKLAYKALDNMALLLKPEGDMRILRRFYPHLTDKLLGRTSFVHIHKQTLQEDRNSKIKAAVRQIRLPRFYRWKQTMHNIHATAYFGQSQWRLPDNKGRIRPARGMIWDPERETFVQRTSIRGHQIYCRFILQVLRNPFPAPYFEIKMTDKNKP